MSQSGPSQQSKHSSPSGPGQGVAGMSWGHQGSQRILSHFSRVQLSATLWTVNSLGSSVHAILQARPPEWVAMPSSRGSSPPKDQTQVSGQEHWSGLSFPSSGDLPDPEMEPTSLTPPCISRWVKELVPPQSTRFSSHQPLRSAG